MKEYDVLIVGSGACGGIAAQQLTEAGLQVIMLEAGPDYTNAEVDIPVEQTTTASIVQQEQDSMSEATRLAKTPGNWRNDIYQMVSIILGWHKPEPKDSLAIANSLSTNPRYPIQSMVGLFGPNSQNLFVDEIDNPYMTPASSPFYWIRNRVLGGRTQTWQRKSPRLEDTVFSAADRDGYGEPWPFTAKDLQPYYEIAEKTMRVMGAVEAGAALYEEALPARDFLPIESAFVKDLNEKWPEMRAHVMPFACPYEESEQDVFTPAPTLDGGRHPSFDCSVRCSISTAQETGLLTVKTDAIVKSVTMDWKTKRATGVSYIDAETKEEKEVSAEYVVLCASTLESTRVLLNSKSDHAPDGLANSSGALGHYLMDHLFGVGAIGVKSQKALQGGSPTLWIPPFRNVEGDNENHGFIRGYQLNCSFSGLWSGFFRRYRQMVVIMADGEVLPRYENQISIDESVKDKWGIPVLRINYQRSENDEAMLRDMLETTEEIIEATGYEVVYRSPSPLPPGLSVHELGTARMGSNPKTSVVDTNCRSWDVPNLYVTDGAVFPTAGSQNPTLTMMALTAKACDHLIESFKA
jgi:choline dehydrogenase-like flavoprotein